MRSRNLVRLALALVILLPATIACGGKTPPAQEADNTSSAAKSDDSAAPASSSAPAASDSSATTAPASTGSAAAAGDSGDIKAPTGDDPWLASHQMAPKDVMRTMKAANSKVQACWKAALKNDPSAAGEVKIRFVVTNDGAVRAWRDDGSSMSDGDVTQCVGELVNKLKFPKQKSPGDAWGAYSIHFSP